MLDFIQLVVSLWESFLKKKGLICRFNFIADLNLNYPQPIVFIDLERNHVTPYYHMFRQKVM